MQKRQLILCFSVVSVYEPVRKWKRICVFELKPKNVMGKMEKLEIPVQDSHMTEEEREAFYRNFLPNEQLNVIPPRRSSVMGGLFRGESRHRLIVAIGRNRAPMVCTEQKILQGYFEEEGKDGFAYAYQYPGMNKVGGRAGHPDRVRSGRHPFTGMTGSGVGSTELFPREWSDVKRVSLSSLEQELQAFWSRFPEVQ